MNRRILISSYPTRRPVRSRELVEFPRWIGGKVVMVPMSWDAIPAGWQSVNIRVPMRPASCAETDCPSYLGGWTEVVTQDGATHNREGMVSQDEAAATFGLYGPLELPPSVIHHPPGTPCGQIHKVPSGLPPVYVVDGRVVLWSEFEDALGGGVHRAQQLRAAGY